jgi:hypothetical protein
LQVVLSKRLKGFLPQPALEQNSVPFEGKAVALPDKLAEPSPGSNPGLAVLPAKGQLSKRQRAAALHKAARLSCPAARSLHRLNARQVL